MSATSSLKSLAPLLRPYRDGLLLFAVLALSSLVSIGIVLTRIAYSGQTAYVFFFWNLFLAWLPFFFAVPLFHLHARGRRVYPALLGLGFFWLLFFPNAPYLLTEFVHLHPAHKVGSRPLPEFLGRFSPKGNVPVWYDVILIVSFAWNGLLLGFLSLYLVQRVTRSLWGAAWSWAVVVAATVLGAFGVSLGRFQRWNSWDLFSRPLELLADVAGRMFMPWSHPRTTTVTVLYAAVLLLGYLALVALLTLHQNMQAGSTPQAGRT